MNTALSSLPTFYANRAYSFVKEFLIHRGMTLSFTNGQTFNRDREEQKVRVDKNAPSTFTVDTETAVVMIGRGLLKNKYNFL